MTVNSSDAAGDKLVYAVWAQEWERSNAQNWYLTENRVSVAAHECGHLLGAYDEYTGGVIDTVSNKIETDSIMGQNLIKGHDRHMDGLRDQVKSIINMAIARTWEFEFSVHKAKKDSITSGSVMLNDYMFRKPALSLKQKSDYKLNLDLEVYDYANRYPVTDAGDNVEKTGKHLAQVRMEAAQVMRPSKRVSRPRTTLTMWSAR